MAVVWSTFCALAALAAAVPQRASTDAQGRYRTKVLPGNGYIRYEVQPGDDEEPPGELIVVHEERRAAPAPAAADTGSSSEDLAPRAQRPRERPCASERSKLLARMFELQGLQVDSDFATWLERNRGLAMPPLYYGVGEPQLVSAVRNDSIARSLAEDVARCEQR